MRKVLIRFLQVCITLAFIAGGAFGMKHLTESKPQMEHQKTEKAAPVVRIVEITSKSQNIVIRGEGTVHPLTEINLVPQVGGKLVYVSKNLVNGGYCKKGETLLKIDPVDYHLAVTLAEARVKARKAPSRSPKRKRPQPKRSGNSCSRTTTRSPGSAGPGGEGAPACCGQGRNWKRKRPI